MVAYFCHITHTFIHIPLYIYIFEYSEIDKEQLYLLPCIPFSPAGWESQSSSLISVHSSSLLACYALEPFWVGLGMHLKNGSNLSITVYHVLIMWSNSLNISDLCKIEIVTLTSMVLMRIRWSNVSQVPCYSAGGCSVNDNMMAR